MWESSAKAKRLIRSKSWKDINERRSILIRKKVDRLGMTEDEQQEYEALQGFTGAMLALAFPLPSMDADRDKLDALFQRLRGEGKDVPYHARDHRAPTLAEAMDGLG